MISRDDIQQLIDRPDSEAGILTVYLDMSVNKNQKRTYQVFLNQKKAEHPELDSDRANHHQEPLGEAFDQLERWLGSEFDESKKGVAFFRDLGGDWTEVHQVSVPLENRIEIYRRPVVAPLVEILERYHHHGVVVVDREHLRLMSLFLDQTLNEREVETEPYPAPHDVKRGGFSAKDFQDRKAEETKHFFKEFADEVQAFVRRHDPDDLILLGTHENVQKFREFLPDSAERMIAHTDRMDIEATAPEIRDRLAPIFQDRLEEEEARVIQILRERVRQSHKAVAGVDETLKELQEGKLEALVITRGMSQRGGRCDSCGFFLTSEAGSCPYCGGTVTNSVDLGETMVRLAADQGIEVDFVPASAMGELGGVGGLLRF
ncbi:MAG: VLRF1 family aeRF1-type release factor [Longimicrobiales bacterium]|nr:VLRF1 family aeRF1-type release factor [Longimicrobiales bacterium]